MKTTKTPPSPSPPPPTITKRICFIFKYAEITISKHDEMDRQKMRERKEQQATNYKCPENTLNIKYYYID